MEFIIVMPGASLETAQKHAEQWRAAFDALCVTYGGEALHSTPSIGVAAFPVHGSTVEQVLRAVDHALYAAKDAGRNCVRVWRDSAD